MIALSNASALSISEQFVPICTRMTSLPFVSLFLTVWAALVKALAVAAQPSRGTCARCGHPVERRQLGGRVCRCSDR
jgi:hypothetical protein